MSDSPAKPAIARTLLVVDDEAGVRVALSFFLSDCGYRVMTADSGRAAVALFDTELIDGALVDLHMPGMNGIDTCRALHVRAAQLGRTLHVWFMSGAYTRELERRCAELGVICVFRKPFEWPATLNRLEEGFSTPAPTPTPTPGPACVALDGKDSP